MLNSKQRAMIKKHMAQEPAVCFVGKEGLSENCITSITQALTAREAIKIAVLQNCDLTAREVADEIEKTIKADIVSVMGKKIIVYKYSAHAKKHIDISCQ